MIFNHFNGSSGPTFSFLDINTLSLNNHEKTNTNSPLNSIRPIKLAFALGR